MRALSRSLIIMSIVGWSDVIRCQRRLVDEYFSFIKLARAFRREKEKLSGAFILRFMINHFDSLYLFRENSRLEKENPFPQRISPEELPPVGGTACEKSCYLSLLVLSGDCEHKPWISPHRDTLSFPPCPARRHH